MHHLFKYFVLLNIIIILFGIIVYLRSELAVEVISNSNQTCINCSDLIQSLNNSIEK